MIPKDKGQKWNLDKPQKKSLLILNFSFIIIWLVILKLFSFIKRLPSFKWKITTMRINLVENFPTSLFSLQVTLSRQINVRNINLDWLFKKRNISFIFQ